MAAKYTPLYPRLFGQAQRSKPYGMDEMALPSREHRKFLEEQALSIFTDCSNAGAPLRESLAAILLTGMAWGNK